MATGAFLQSESRLARPFISRRFSTGNGVDSAKFLVRDGRRRSSVSGFSFKNSDPQKIIRELERRVTSQMSTESKLSAQFIFLRCMPVHTAGSCAETLQRWLHEPLLVTNEALSGILNIQLSTATSARLSSSAVCYFRSWTMSAWQLRIVIDDLISQGFCDDLLRAWMFTLRTCSSETIVTPRYVGTTSSPSNPWQRTQAQPKRPNSIKGAFVDSLAFLFPDVEMSHEIYSIQNTATIDLTFQLTDGPDCILRINATETLADEVEKAMIGFFQPRTLLNCQSGGKQSMATPHPLDERAFLRCGTSLLASLQSLEVIRNSGIAHKVADIFEVW